MARIKRHATRRLWRRSREEKRRLSEGGGGTVTQQTSEADNQSNSDLKIVLEDLTVEEIDRAYHCVFHFNEVYGSLLLKEDGLRDDIEKFCQLKASMDEKITNIKMMIRSPDSERIKKLKAATRRSSELQDVILTLEQDLASVKLGQTVAEANYVQLMCTYSQ
ncbi:hypothetical protein PAHAL_5G063800 [Panicum hallii]|uniref:Uncharacterized protein n=1 Tax=Panicum hallii TaxID=206008 RepID=A0A2S3HP83_9POAL|nr:uncharacterized protein LOC112895664 [Panicum hallii]PAN27174.1 hypothetical protein PAHAL_5G063800 [Panicum hallii]